MKKLILKLLGEPRKRRAVWVGLLITSLAVLSIVGLTEARYVLQWESAPISYDSQAFYFTSDHLTEGSMTYSIGNFVPDSSGINFELRNYEDSLKVSECDIAYTVQLKDTNTNNQISTSSGTINISERTEAINLTVPASSFSSGGAKVTVTASATSPYTKTLSATYNLYQALTDYDKAVSDSANSNTLTLTITTGNTGGTITFTPPAGVNPVNTDNRLTISSGNVCSFNADPTAEYQFSFTKTTPATVYTVNNFNFG